MQTMQLTSDRVSLQALAGDSFDAKRKSRPLVFLHGFPDIASTFKAQLEHFSKSRSALALTLPGYLGSTQHAEIDDYRIDRVADQISQALVANFPQGIDLVAHDWGGVAAWFITAKKLISVKTLTIINAPHPAIYREALLDDPVQKAVFKYVEIFSSPQGESVCSRDEFAAIKRFLIGDIVTDKDEAASYVAAWSAPGVLTAGLNYYRANKDYMSNPQHDGLVVDCPTLVYWGLKDHALSPRNTVGLDKFAKAITLETRPGLGHWSFRQDTNDFNATLERHLARHSL